MQKMQHDGLGMCWFVRHLLICFFIPININLVRQAEGVIFGVVGFFQYPDPFLKDECLYNSAHALFLLSV